MHRRLSLFIAPLNAARSSQRDDPTARIQTVCTTTNNSVYRSGNGVRFQPTNQPRGAQASMKNPPNKRKGTRAGTARGPSGGQVPSRVALQQDSKAAAVRSPAARPGKRRVDRKSTRLNSSHVRISYAVFCLKKKKITQ